MKGPEFATPCRNAVDGPLMSTLSFSQSLADLSSLSLA